MYTYVDVAYAIEGKIRFLKIAISARIFIYTFFLFFLCKVEVLGRLLTKKQKICTVGSGVDDGVELTLKNHIFPFACQLFEKLQIFYGGISWGTWGT